MKITGTHIGIALMVLFFTCQIAIADELVHKFKSPSFSGIGTSSHYLTIENQEFSRKKAVADDIEERLCAIDDRITKIEEHIEEANAIDPGLLYHAIRLPTRVIKCRRPAWINAAGDCNIKLPGSDR